MTYRISIIILVALVCISCDRRSKMNFEGGVAEGEAIKALAPPQKMANFVVQREKEERMLIKNGEISFATEHIDSTKEAVVKICRDFHAYISLEEQDRLDSRIQYHQVIRIPSSRFDAFVRVVEGLGIRIDSRTIESEDVSEEFYDTQARLKTKKELESRYLQLLVKAKTVEDMLNIERQVADVRSEIERMEGRIKYLTNKVDYSTLSLTYYETTRAEEFGFGSRISSALAIGWTSLLAFLVGLAAVWPFLLFLGTGIWLIFRWVRRNGVRVQAVVSKENNSHSS